MRAILNCFVISVLLLTAGCETGGSLSERFSTPPPHTHLFEHSAAEQVQAATKQTLLNMGFKVVRSSLSDGRIDAVNSVRADAALRGSSQISVKITLEENLDGATLMQVWMTEVVEDSFNGAGGYGTRMPLKASPLYEVLFRGVEQTLGLPQKD